MIVETDRHIKYAEFTPDGDGIILEVECLKRSGAGIGVFHASQRVRGILVTGSQT
jgi:hypothetical protein